MKMKIKINREWIEIKSENDYNNICENAELNGDKIGCICIDCEFGTKIYNDMPFSSNELKEMKFND